MTAAGAIRLLLDIARTLLLGLILLVLAWSACVQTSQVRVPASTISR